VAVHGDLARPRAVLAGRTRPLFGSALAGSALAHAALAGVALALGVALEQGPAAPSLRVLEVALVGPLLNAAQPAAPAATAPASVPPPSAATPAPARAQPPPRAARPTAERAPSPVAPPARPTDGTPSGERPLSSADRAASAAGAPAPHAPAPRGLVTARPRYKRNPEPPYPLDARRRRQQGTVLLSVHVSAAGAPQAVAVARSSGFRALDAAAASAVARWEFEPGRRDGEAVDSDVEVPIRFQLR
jgi:protein TonB